MTTGLKIIDIATAIAALKITGLKIRDLDEIKENMNISDRPCLVPHPKNYISNFQVAHGVMGRGNDKATYTLNYRLYFRPVTGTIKFFGPYKELVEMTIDILEKIINADPIAGVFDVMPSLGALGGVEDHAGNVYHGCDIEFNVTEYLE